MQNKKQLHDFYTRDSGGKLHMNVKSVLFGGYDPQETDKVVEEMTAFYQDIITELLQQIREKDCQLAGRHDI